MSNTGVIGVCKSVLSPRVQELCECRGGRPGLSVPYKPTVSVDLKFIVQELCESRGGRPGLSVLTSLLVSVDVKIY